MAPKNAPPAAKQAKILAWFQETMGVYTFKELEKALPSVAGINSMQAKEYLQALTDESLIRCEKIGSGNWYWCFVSDARKQKENQIRVLKAEEERLLENIGEMEKAVEEVVRGREEDEEMAGMLEGGVSRKVLMDVHESLAREAGELDAQLARFADCDPAEVTKKMDETRVLKDGAIRWTDNVESLASYLGNLAGREAASGAMASACGDEYVLGEGLRELVDP